MAALLEADRLRASAGSIDEPLTRSPRRGRKAVALVILLALVGTLLAWGIPYLVYGMSHESTDDAFIEADVVPVSPSVSGHIVDLRVEDNQLVHAGDIIAIVDPRDYQVRLNESKAALNTAQSKLNEASTALSVLKAEVDQANADLLAAKAEAQLRHEDRDRYEAMAKGAASGFELSNVRAAAASADAKVQSAQAHVAAAEAHVSDGTAQVASAQAEVDQAKTDVAQAELKLSYTKITAPVDGRVTRRTIQAGLYVEPGQTILALVPSDVWVVANFKETQLTKMRAGQPVDIHIDAYPAKNFRGHVGSIQEGTGSRFSLLPPENATGNYVKVVQRVPVKIVFDEKPSSELMLAPGMSVEPDVKVK